MAEENTQFKKITFREFKPDEYKVWEVTTRATLKLNKLLGIVEGTDPDPTPRNPDGTARVIPPALRARVTKWENDHERAREAIIRCLPNAELLKLVDVQDDAPAIWKRLRDEYGRPSNLEYVRASNDLALLKKDEKTSMNDHINRFEQLVYEVNYNKPSDTQNMKESVVNLKFLNTLMTDKSSSEKWETFINAKGPQLEQMSTQQLYAEVRVNAARIKPADTPSNEAKALMTTEFQQAIHALNTKIDGLQRGISNGGRGNGNRYGGKGRNRGDSNGGRRGGSRRGGRGGRGGRSGNSRRYRHPYDPNKYCELHDRRGHSTEECWTANREARETESSNQHADSSNYQSRYQPSFNRPRQFSAKATRLIVNSTEIEHTSDPQAWIIDSAANAYITPYKECLHNYREFPNRVQVKGFAGKAEIARGTGSIILTDKAGNRVNLKDVVYVPESPDQILSLMKLRRERNADFRFTAVEEFVISFPNGVRFSGKSVDDICYIWTSSAIRINVVVTRNASKKRKSLEELDHGEEDENFTSEPENQPIRERESARVQNATGSRDSSLKFTNPRRIDPLLCSPHDLWHLRFGHASTTTLRKHPYIKSSFDSTHCTICIRAKQARKPFHPSESKVTRKLERIHSDLCGPFPISKGKTIYVLTFLDEYTHWCWVVTLADKSSSTVCKEYRYLIKQIETESDLKIKYLRTDGGKEYQGDLRPVLKELGIQHEPNKSPFAPIEWKSGTVESYTRGIYTRHALSSQHAQVFLG
jgi:hypothetical protein